MDQWYFTNHADWYNTSPFREASSLLPSVNIWDDRESCSASFVNTFRLIPYCFPP